MRHYSYPTDVQDCPYCGFPCEADWVDVGVGYQQCGPFHCESCGACQIGPYDTNFRTEEEEKIGWYRSQIGNSANTVDGKLVSHRVAQVAYRSGRLDSR